MEATSDKAAETYARLKAALLRANAPPGTFLNIRNIAGRMNVSPTPVREALIRLAEDELIGFAANRGYYVKHVNLEELRAEYEIAHMISRYSIEKSAAGFDHVDPASRPDPDRLVANPPQSNGEVDSVAAYLEGLYKRFAMLSGNARLVRSIRLFSERTGQIRRLGLVIEPKFIDYLSRMEAIDDFLSAGDRHAALRLLDDQYHIKEALLENVVRELGIRSFESDPSLPDLFS
jgi:DNA-binding GntR family transcriptional regulator